MIHYIQLIENILALDCKTGGNNTIPVRIIVP